MSIGGTPLNSNSNQLNSDQLLGQLEDLKRQGKGFGNRQLVVDSKGQLAVKATPFEKFCNWITFKSSFPQEGDAFFKLQAMLKRDYGSFVSEKVLASLIGNKKPITVNEAIGRARLAKGQFQELIQPFQQEIQNLAHKNPIEAQRLGAAWNSMMVSLQPNEAQKQVLCELVGHAKDPSKVLAFAHAATNNPIGARQFLSNLSGLEQNSRSQEFSSLLAEGKSSFVECTRCFWQLSNTDPVANASNQIHYAMQSNPATDGLTRATQGAAEIAKHLITAPGQLANEGFILGLKTMLAEGRMLPGINNAFFAQQLDRLQHDPGLREQLMNIGRNGISPVAHQAIRETLGLPPGAPITPKEAQQAALAALLSPLRQGKVGSCFATSVAINIHDTRPSEMLRDMASLIEKGFIERQNGNAHVQIPF
ncbi:MAG: hypothetical protein LBJ78_04320, partial [Puniceicoccales bacterium]|nr:hypothetical protein [Puniceicoccales bacterium]